MEDTVGNKLFKEDDTIFLKLKAEPYRRKLAIIKDDTLVMTRSKSKHLHKQMNSYGFNYQLLSTAELVEDIILIVDNDYMYRFPIKLVLDKGKFLYFKQQGFEKQIFLNLDLIHSHYYDRLNQKI